MPRHVPVARRRFAVALVLALSLVPPLLAPRGAVRAQDEPPPGVAVVAAGLTNPRGMTWDDDGDLLVALAGRGGETPASGEIAVPPPVGPWSGGPTASLVQVDAAGCPTTVVEGLPSAIDSTGGVLGAADVAVLDGAVYVLIAGGGEAHGNPESPNGVYAVGDGGVSLVADLSAWLRENPVAEVPPADYDPEGGPYNMIVGPDGLLWVSESNSEQVLTVSPEGEVARVADLSADDGVPTGLAPAPNGNVFVSYLSGVPYVDGTAKVLEIDAGGDVSDAWTDLTTVTGVAVGPDGGLYATEMATDNLRRPPFTQPGTGKVVRQAGPAEAEEVLTGLNFPISLDFGPDGALYVAYPAIGADDGSGAILRVDLAEAELPLDLSDVEFDVPDCAAGEAADGGTAEGIPTNVTIEIVDFFFEPAEVTIKVGTTVTWVNVGPTDHTTTAYVDGKKFWDSAIMVEGDKYSVTFTQPGDYDYLCALHPSMTARLIVEE